MDDLTLVAVVAIALFFDFTNGFHDTANSIATSVSTRALSPRLRRDQLGDPQLHRRVLLLQGRGDGRQGHRRPGGDHAQGRARRARRRDHLEPDHVVHRAPLELEPRADRRDHRLGRGGRPAGFDVVEWARPQGEGAHSVAPGAGRSGSARGGADDVAHLWLIRKRAPGPVNRRLPAPPAGLGRLRRLHPRHERRAEDDGRDHARADRVRPPVGGALLGSALGDDQRRDGDGHGHLRGRLAHHQNPREPGRQARAAAGLRRPDLDRSDPLGDGALRVPGLDDAHGQRLGARRGREHPPLGGALGSRRQHPHRLGADHPVRGLVAAGMEAITRLPGGVAYVFALTGAIAALAFIGRNLETRRLRARAATA